MEERREVEEASKLEALRVLDYKMPIDWRHIPFEAPFDHKDFEGRAGLNMKSHIADILCKDLYFEGRAELNMKSHIADILCRKWE
jgi:hypothetical protein